ncbi:hypothetical protein GSI_06017 [Ganoderma sinense ZZ0214-1]|uniref:Copper transporter n=1 Tax=Ganoderma sinense ZZ0214-1 TaxID=1077348 RepID=A0A2G8SC35_9APHY|nr:hypothetical protein GSI_06017 [Ganoderma sinense ZZ0214-1]
MIMNGGWEDHLHWGYLGEHVLVAGLHLDSAWSFFLASLLTICICFSERVLTYVIAKKWHPWSSRGRPSRFGLAVWRTLLYWLVTFERLLYMLIGMTFSFGLILIAVSTLAAGQFVIEFLDLGERPRSEYVSPSTFPLPPFPTSSSLTLSPRPSFPPSTENANVKEPLLSSSDESYALEASYPPPSSTRPRSRSKPESIFIHPNDSNIARADAAAAQLGLAGDTDLVKGNVYPADGETWEHGRGRDVARELLLSPVTR